MGIEMRLHLVDGDLLLKLLDMDWNELVQAMDSNSLRSSRPAMDARLNRTFDIDCEAEFLDLADHISGEGTTREVLSQSRGHEALLKLVEWSSCGHWEAWEGRCFLYIENAIDHTVDNVESMYLDHIWDEVASGLSSLSESDFSEKVCEDWMNRRKELGETLDESMDPHIIPTFEAHDRAARALHYAMLKEGFVKILGREHLEAKNWGHGEWNLGVLLDS